MSGLQVLANSGSSKDPLNIANIEVDIVEDVKPVVACRGCLVTDQPLRPIDHKLINAFRLLMSTLQIQECDMYPKYMCTYCRALLVRFTAFREKCLSVQTALTNIHSADTPITQDMIKSDNQISSYPLQTTSIKVISYKPPFHKQIYKLQTSYHETSNDLKIELSDSESQINYDMEFEVPPFTAETVNKTDDIDLANYSSFNTHRKNSKRTLKSEQERNKRKKATVKREDNLSSDSDTPLHELADNNFYSIKNSDVGDCTTSRNTLNAAELSLKDVKDLPEKVKSNKKKKRQKISKKLIVLPKKKRAQKSVENIVSVGNSNEIIDASVDDIKTGLNKNKCCVKTLKTCRKNKIRPYNKHIDDEKRHLDLEKEFDIKIVELTKEQQLRQVREKKDSLSYQQAKFKCELCYNVFILKETYNNHMAKHQVEEGEDVCEICLRSVNSKKMTEHVKLHHKFDYICNQCGHVSKILGSAKIHHRWHKGIKYDCKICGKCFDKPTSVLGHMHLSHKDVMVKCTICSKQCIGDKGLKSHMNLSHKEAVGAVCASCGVQFHSMNALQRHQAHGAGCDTTRACVACGLGFATDSLLRHHRSSCNSKKQYSCDFCSQSFDSQIRYKKHVTTHTSYHRLYSSSYMPKCSSYMCEHCGKKCRTKQIFDTHTRTHTGERPFVCDYCGKAFAAKPLLGIHINRHMEKLSMKATRMYDCRYCGKQFTCPANKRRHEMTNHQGLVQFNCEICGATFTTKKAMKDHVRHTHEGVPWPKRVRNRRQ